jgi:hypothetical protein
MESERLGERVARGYGWGGGWDGGGWDVREGMVNRRLETWSQRAGERLRGKESADALVYSGECV